MYFADMYCYGKDSRCVGVTGIRQCMGIFFAYDKMLYVLHAPDSGRFNAQVPGIFADYVKAQIGKIQAKKARLYFVLNKDNRQRVEGELEQTCKAIGLKTYTLMRIRKNIGLVNGLQAMDESIVVACQYVPNVKGSRRFCRCP